MPRYPGAEPIYEAAELFRQRCLVDQSSLLWPDQHAWTIANLNSLWDAFIERPDDGKRSFMEKWQDQLADQPLDVHRIAADVMTFYYLFPANIGSAAKLSGVEKVLSWKLAADGLPPAWPLVQKAFKEKIGNTGPYYLTGRPWQIAFYLGFARQILVEGVDPYDARACTALANQVNHEISGSITARHILLHLLFPDQFERIASNSHKRQIVKAFSAEADGAEDLDDALFNIQHALAERHGVPNVNFYHPDLRPLWGNRDDEQIETGNGDAPPVRPATGLRDLIAATHLRQGDLEEIGLLLREKRQLIFEGPPGSGKTYVAELFARWFAGVPLGSVPDPRVELVQFHQSYGYEDFVQGIRPETDADGRLSYRVRDGIFKRLCSLAASHPDQKYVLIIDEINRGNVARIFGELLLLLEYRDKRARLPYALADDDSEAYLTIPENLYLIGTMNSTDRSLAQVDYALRRRFYFVQFQPEIGGRAPVLEGWLRAANVPPQDRVRILRLFVTLNQRVQERLGPDFQVGHSYFMQASIATAEGLNRVWQRAVGPLLQEYFHAHRDREQILADLTPERLVGDVAHNPLEAGVSDDDPFEVES